MVAENTLRKVACILWESSPSLQVTGLAYSCQVTGMRNIKGVRCEAFVGSYRSCRGLTLGSETLMKL